jgi:hypothetical protein
VLCAVRWLAVVVVVRMLLQPCVCCLVCVKSNLKKVWGLRSDFYKREKTHYFASMIDVPCSVDHYHYPY